jgi:hypothetical protein
VRCGQSQDGSLSFSGRASLKGCIGALTLGVCGVFVLLRRQARGGWDCCADCMHLRGRNSRESLWRKFSSSTRRNEKKRARFFIRVQRWKFCGVADRFSSFSFGERPPAARAPSLLSLWELIRLMDNVRNMIWSIYYAGCAYEGRVKNCDGTNLISQTRRRALKCAPGVKICVIIAMRDHALIYPHEPCLIFYSASPAAQW